MGPETPVDIVPETPQSDAENKASSGDELADTSQYISTKWRYATVTKRELRNSAGQPW